MYRVSDLKAAWLDKNESHYEIVINTIDLREFEQLSLPNVTLVTFNKCNIKSLKSFSEIFKNCFAINFKECTFDLETPFNEGLEKIKSLSVEIKEDFIQIILSGSLAKLESLMNITVNGVKDSSIYRFLNIPSLKMINLDFSPNVVIDSECHFENFPLTTLEQIRLDNAIYSLPDLKLFKNQKVISLRDCSLPNLKEISDLETLEGFGLTRCYHPTLSKVSLHNLTSFIFYLSYISKDFILEISPEKIDFFGLLLGDLTIQQKLLDFFYKTVSSETFLGEYHFSGSNFKEEDFLTEQMQKILKNTTLCQIYSNKDNPNYCSIDIGNKKIKR